MNYLPLFIPLIDVFAVVAAVVYLLVLGSKFVAAHQQCARSLATIAANIQAGNAGSERIQR